MSLFFLLLQANSPPPGFYSLVPKPVALPSNFIDNQYRFTDRARRGRARVHVPILSISRATRDTLSELSEGEI